jgi:cysteine-rich repeat protein
MDGASEYWDSGDRDSSTSDSAASDAVDFICGDGLVSPDELCDEGPQNSNAPDAPCRPDCTPRRCGDGIVDTVEACDDGNHHDRDGCSADCRSDETCGNGIVDPWEACDEGALNSNEPDASCRINCVPRQCGDGILDTGEACDGPAIGGLTCSDLGLAGGPLRCGLDCEPDPESCDHCDDGIAGISEICDGSDLKGATCVDVGFLNGVLRCTADCSLETSGCRWCGDGVVDPGEECDDGGLVSRDGCSSGCTVEPLRWTGRPSRIPKGDRFAALLDFPALGGLVLMNGGSSLTGEAWTYDGETFTRLPPELRLGVNESCKIVHDSVRGRLVSYCGGNGIRELDGVAVEQVELEPSPPSRMSFSLAFDSARGVTVMFGGGYQYKYWDTWEYDGTSWQEVATANHPSGRSEATMVYDSARGVAVLFGGRPYNAELTWEYDGVDWVSRSTATRPAWRYAQPMVYDPVRQRVVMTMGRNDSRDFDDTWEYDGVDWTRVVTRDHPTGAFNAGFGFDAARGVAVLLGGNTVCNTGADLLWEYDGSEWTARFTIGERRRTAAARDTLRRRTVLFGGEESCYADATTWVLEDDAWTMLHPAHRPTPRFRHALAYDAWRDRVVLFGGYEEVRGSFGSNMLSATDTWEFDGTDWSEVVTQMAPPARSLHRLVFDPLRGVTVLFGGYEHCPPGCSNNLGDTWEYDGSEWVERTLPHSPPLRWGASVAFDSARGVIVLFGGQHRVESPENLEDTWEYDGLDWTEVTDAGGPSASSSVTLPDAAFFPPVSALVMVVNSGDYDHAWQPLAFDGVSWQPLLLDPPYAGSFEYHLAYDEERRTLVSISGRSAQSSAPDYADHYELGFQPTWPDEDCQSDSDLDADRLAGCEDPDCEGRRCAGGRCRSGVCQ